MRFEFEKWEAIGNDFVVVRDLASNVGHWQSRAADLCDRHVGIGADGILVVDASVPSMTVVNADGSVSEMCGNGIRCVVGHLLNKTGAQSAELRLRSEAGWHDCSAVRGRDRCWDVRVGMGTPSFAPSDASATSAGGPLDAVETIAGPAYIASIGNPHLVLFDPPASVNPAVDGPRLERDPRFAKRTNVEFVTERADGGLDVIVWERGVGFTQACGSGAVCVAAVAVGLGRRQAGTPVAVHLPGGALECTVEDGGAVTMKGPARLVYSGVLGQY
jgi:diaminopimelate epimerase